MPYTVPNWQDSPSTATALSAANLNQLSDAITDIDTRITSGEGHAHTQSSPAATWIIDHGLGRKVHVTIFDTAETVIYADVDHGTTNQATITFPSPVAGSAFIS